MWSALRRVLFWTYSRGSWQYDLIVLAILAFIFLTPASLFDGSLFRGKAQVSESQPSDPLSVAAKPSSEPEKEPPAAGPSRPKDDQKP